MLDDNTDGGAVMLRPITVQCAGIVVVVNSSSTVHSTSTFAIFDLSRIFRNENYCVSRGVSVIGKDTKVAADQLERYREKSWTQ